MQFATTATLNIAFETGGPIDGDPALLLHGWPDDVRTYDRVVPVLHAAGLRTVVPYLRGFGDTSFLSKDAKRSGEMIAMAQDAIDLADALNLETFTVIGHDWGARIAYALAIAVPHRVRRMVTISVGWQPGDLPTPSLKQAQAYWYQWFMATKRGRQMVRTNGKAFARIQWETWSPPGWFNLDWPEITWHSYSVRWGEADKDPRYFDLDRRVHEAQSISIRTLMIQGGSDTVTLPDSTEGKDRFFYRRLYPTCHPGCGPFSDPRGPGCC